MGKRVAKMLGTTDTLEIRKFIVYTLKNQYTGVLFINAAETAHKKRTDAFTDALYNVFVAPDAPLLTHMYQAHWKYHDKKKESLKDMLFTADFISRDSSSSAVQYLKDFKANADDAPAWGAYGTDTVGPAINMLLEAGYTWDDLGLTRADVPVPTRGRGNAMMQQMRNRSNAVAHGRGRSNAVVG